VELHGGGIRGISRTLSSIPAYQLRIEFNSAVHQRGILSERADDLEVGMGLRKFAATYAFFGTFAS
jgi:hypothetical protein